MFSTLPRRARAWRTLAVVLTLALIAAGAGCSSKPDDGAPAATTASNATLTPAQRQHIRLYTVAPSSYRKTVDTSGVVDFDNDQATSVLAPFSGPVSKLLVVVGQHVAKGDPLALVESPDFAAAVSSYRKALVTASNARRLADMDKDLVQHDGVAGREAAQAETDAANAEADRAAALQALVALGVDAQTIQAIQQGRPVAHVAGIIRAPIGGTVVEKLITPGQLLQAGTTPCFTVADLSRVWVMAQVFGADLDSVHVGDTAEVVTGSDAKSLTGTVANVAALVDPNTRSVNARVVVANPDDLLKKQMYVRVLLQSRQESHGLLIPVSAVLRDDDNLPFVYVEQVDGSFARRHVTLGYRAGDRYDIPTGLRSGDKVVTDGGIFVQFMQAQ
jgi:cobalt-zinc-cadmium efflux system membrane fusion protein